MADGMQFRVSVARFGAATDGLCTGIVWNDGTLSVAQGKAVSLVDGDVAVPVAAGRIF